MNDKIKKIIDNIIDFLKFALLFLKDVGDWLIRSLIIIFIVDNITPQVKMPTLLGICLLLWSLYPLWKRIIK